MNKNIRALAARCSFAVVDQGRSLADELPKAQQQVDAKDKGLLQELCYGVLRYLPELENQIRVLMDKPLTGKKRVFHFLLLVGIYQLKYTRIPDHAAVAETVAGCSALKGKHFKALINAVLRSYQRLDTPPEVTNDAVRYNHPGWFIKKLQLGYPDSWQDILAQNMLRPPMWLRVNRQKTSLADYLALLEQAEIAVDYQDKQSQALRLVQPVDVNKLPHFHDGWVSIQDGAAQHAARLLDSQGGERVLDCCAAPGGKTGHILELTPNIQQLTAMDIDPQRLSRIDENLKRLNLEAELITGDAADPQSWWDGKPFDRILLDAPCSGTGVIRRHPDIKWLRRASDIDQLVVLQQKIIDACWQLLAPGGTLVYATCSILPQENKEQIKNFIQRTPNAILEQAQDESTDVGWQILPGDHGMDGFFYAKIRKTEEQKITIAK
jgi:16S rRNA (cytosine967-C5)-methyltransferase